MVVMARVAALRVQRGDRVSVRGQWREVKAVRSDRFASGGLVVVLVFTSGLALRLNAADGLAVERGGRGLR
ncbi:hypothetical protein G3I60_06570 [Streptomyces sp. SID13666]|uniref:hypothetical protein n=1 Tax=Streptomyces TaxID=1883 RepID=UPI0013C0AB89|nr:MULTISPECIES: hypothetical protein [Streptomyces]MCZ4101880.1 hypothetical protein [Streptomyces sp. H39-C1]NEA53831.1 hypothetical protein [Streptomyces sp. SID13666]NEA76721.1 hypothetical protein [Streptomyces sp. SID13588]QNA76846.1 hypothetical protein C8250_037695 [Streptomyces sp. So13.3]